MACKHEQLRCTDNVFYCALCGASWVAPPAVDKESTPAEKPAEARNGPLNARPRKGVNDHGSHPEAGTV